MLLAAFLAPRLLAVWKTPAVGVVVLLAAFMAPRVLSARRTMIGGVVVLLAAFMAPSLSAARRTMTWCPVTRFAAPRRAFGDNDSALAVDLAEAPLTEVVAVCRLLLMSAGPRAAGGPLAPMCEFAP